MIPPEKNKDQGKVTLKNPSDPFLPSLKIGLLGVLLSLLIFIALLPLRREGAAENQPSHPPPLKGMALGLFSKEKDYNYTKELDQLKTLGVNAILLMIPWYQKDIHSDLIEPRYGVGLENSTIKEDLLEKVIRSAHNRGMQVVLLPYLRFDHREAKEWRGVLEPKNISLWKENYQRFLLHYADLAQRLKVEYLSVGSELGSMEDKTDFWMGLIQKIRGRYPGKLLYSANWDHYKTPQFWSALDAIGITAYFRLTWSTKPRLTSLLSHWKKNKKKILKFQKEYPRKKIIFTEVGYPSLDGACRHPWDYTMNGEADPEEQALCYRAFIETWNGIPQIEGVFWWYWYEDGGPQDKSYSPKGKPAEGLLRQWYSGRPKASFLNLLFKGKSKIKGTSGPDLEK